MECTHGLINQQGKWNEENSVTWIDKFWRSNAVLKIDNNWWRFSAKWPEVGWSGQVSRQWLCSCDATAHVTNARSAEECHCWRLQQRHQQHFNCRLCACWLRACRTEPLLASHLAFLLCSTPTLSPSFNVKGFPRRRTAVCWVQLLCPQVSYVSTDCVLWCCCTDEHTCHRKAPVW